jgi:hypothetical protein
MTKLKAAEWFVILGGISLLYCAWNAIYDPESDDPSVEHCEEYLWKDESVRTPIDDDKAGKLRIVGVHPSKPPKTEINKHTKTEINKHLCVSVAGVVSQAVETEADEEVKRLGDECQGKRQS